MASSRDPKRARPAGLDAVVTTLDFPGLDDIRSMAVDTDGMRFALTASALYAFSPNGTKALIAGHKTETGFEDGNGTDARFNTPYGIAVDGEGNVLVADTNNHALRKVTLRCGTVSTLAGNGEAGYADGIGAAARFNHPMDIAVDAQGAIFVADIQNHCLRQVVPSTGEVSTLAGDAEEEGFADGHGATARFNGPSGVALDTDDHLIVADSGNHCIRKVTTAEGRVTTVAGSAEADAGFADGAAAAARFCCPENVAVDGNNNILVADQGNNRIRMIAGKGGRVTTVAGSAEKGKIDGTGASVRFHEPIVLVLDVRGCLLVLDLENKGSVRVVEASLTPPLSLAPKVQPVKNPLLILVDDYSKLLEDTALADVTFAVDGQRFPAHRCVLAARSPYFRALFESGKGMHEEGSRAAGQDIVIKDVSAGAFRVLLRFLYAHTMPEEEDCEEGLAVGEMARVADRFQASELYAHCVEQFRAGLAVGNVVARVMQAHDSGLAGLEEAAMEYFKANALAFQVS